MNTPTITLNIALFGVFRNSGVSNIELDVPAGSDINAIKQHLTQLFEQQHPNFDSAHLLNTAVLADATRVLNANEQFFTSTQLAILPPVCGG